MPTQTSKPISRSNTRSRKDLSRSRSRKELSRSRSRKELSRSRSRKDLSRSRSRKSVSKTSQGLEWNVKNSVCPKTPSHQLTINREGPNWLRITKNDIHKKKKRNKYEIKRLNKSPGIYIIIILKEDPNTLYLLREFTDLFYRNSLDYPEAPVDDGMIGHSSIYSDQEFQMEWLKELTARDFELEASKTSDKSQQKLLNGRAKRIRQQCLLYFAGQLYYDKEIVVWTNHSGHFQPLVNVKHKVGLPIDKFAPMGSPKINKSIQLRYSK